MTDITDADRDTYEKPAHGWTCFHCGETFTTHGAARDHFGMAPSADPGCRIKLGSERGLLMALRKAEAANDELYHLLHDETCEAYRLLAAQTTRHRDQIMTAEEAGYERGQADGAKAERERVVAWLREDAGFLADIGSVADSAALNKNANEIEQGEHL